MMSCQAETWQMNVNQIKHFFEASLLVPTLEVGPSEQHVNAPQLRSALSRCHSSFSHEALFLKSYNINIISHVSKMSYSIFLKRT